MVKIVMTADRTLMSEYNKHVFLGFAACAPKLIPDWLYTKIFCPPLEKDNKGRAKYGHCGQRKMEAALLNHGFSSDDVAVVTPESLQQIVTPETKVLCITTHDPLGLGPASTTFSDLGGKEPFTSSYFKKLIEQPVIRKYGLKVIVGGSGAWQLTDERIMAKFGIDCVVVGEGEKTGVTIIEKAIHGDPLPNFIEGEVVPLEEIPLIKNPTINGIIEISRGCGRGCRFCNPTMLNFRCIPLKHILQEANLNTSAGNGVILHAEDVLRYKATGFTPNEAAVLELFTRIKKITNNIGISHFAHATVASNPRLIEKISEILQVGSKTCPFFSGQVGIETGSTRIVSKYMKGKAKPFTPEEWPEMILHSHEILSDNLWVPAETIIIGLPTETPDDTRKTIELLHDLSGFKSLIIPLFFVPIGNLNGNGFFKSKRATPEQWQLLAACVRHDFKWIYAIAEENLSSMKMNILKQWAIKNVIRIMEKRLIPYVKIMEEGHNPIKGIIETKKRSKATLLQSGSVQSKITHLMDSLGKM
jgi:radical SAM superfamily enzyme YgiQ (UPF0313 family)